jgi:hypothetical protein
MRAIVVYESHWGNTKAIAGAIAEGLGQEADCLATDEATPDIVAGADLIVAGAPVLAFGLPKVEMVASLPTKTDAPRPADVAAATLRTWLAGVPAAHGGVHAAFETAFRWSPGSATSTIDRELDRAGYTRLAKARRFVVTGTYGPLRDGEIDRARTWGRELAAAMWAAA